MGVLAGKLQKEGHPDSEFIRSRQEAVSQSWEDLTTIAKYREQRLAGAHEIQKFNRFVICDCAVYVCVCVCVLELFGVSDDRDVDETKSWMSEKDTALLSDDYGRDLASVQALQRKHEGLERDLAALEDKVCISLFLSHSIFLLFHCRWPH